MVHLFLICFHAFTRARGAARNDAAPSEQLPRSHRWHIHSQSTDDYDASVVVDVASVQICTRPTLPAVFLCSIHRYVKRISAPASCFSNWLVLTCGQPVSWVRFFQFLVFFLSDSLTQFTASSTMTPPPTTIKVVENIVAFVYIDI